MTVKFRDYYETLNISRDSSQDEIRKVYRKLARKYHPDVNPNNKSAEEKFKDIQEAYAVLSDPEKRRRYDQLGSNWQAGSEFNPPPGWGQGGVEFENVSDLNDIFGQGGGFSDFFQSIFSGIRGDPRQHGSGRQHQRRSRRNDIEAEIDLTLEEIHQGVTKRITLRTVHPCPECGGRGSKRNQTCPTCRGSGKHVIPKSMTVNIAAGARNGSLVRIAGKGEQPHPDGPAGDLFLKIKVLPHSNFEWVGTDDVQIDLPVTPWEAALGTEINVPTLDSSVSMKIPPGTQSGSRFRLRGQGLRLRTNSRGDQFVKIKITVPKNLSQKEMELFQELAKVSEFNPRKS